MTGSPPSWFTTFSAWSASTCSYKRLFRINQHQWPGSAQTHASGAAHKGLFAGCFDGLRQCIFQLIGVLAEAAGSHAYVDLMIELRIFEANGFLDLFQFFDVSFHRPPFQLLEHMLATNLASQFTIGQDYRRTATRTDAARGHQADLSVLRGLSLRDAETLFGRMPAACRCP